MIIRQIKIEFIRIPSKKQMMSIVFQPTFLIKEEDCDFPLELPSEVLVTNQIFDKRKNNNRIKEKILSSILEGIEKNRTASVEEEITRIKFIDRGVMNKINNLGVSVEESDYLYGVTYKNNTLIDSTNNKPKLIDLIYSLSSQVDDAKTIVMGQRIYDLFIKKYTDSDEPIKEINTPSGVLSIEVVEGEILKVK